MLAGASFMTHRQKDGYRSDSGRTPDGLKTGVVLICKPNRGW